MLSTERAPRSYRAYREKCAYWSNKITAYYLSGQKLKPFCTNKGLKVEQFRKWLYKLNLSRPLQAEKEDEIVSCEMELKFLPVTLSDIKERLLETGYLDIILSSGDRIRLSKGFDSETLIRTMVTLRGLSC